MTSSPNRVFKVIWCRWRNAWVVVSELVGSRRARSSRGLARALGSMLLLAAAGLLGQAQAAPAPQQLPTQGQVSAGRASIASAGATMTVTQSSPRAAIDWGSFDIGRQATVRFVQPGRGAIALNRVMSSDPSQIYGHLDANGQVYLLNPNGVYFAPGSSVDVGGIVATTGRMSDAAFLAGSTTFAFDGATGSVINAGTIRSRLGGYIALLAPQVRNEGLLVAQAGTVAMAGGESVRLNFGPDSSLQSLTVTPSQIATLVDNRDAVRAPGGLVILSAQAMNQLAGDVINSGQVQAVGAAEQGGRIVLEAGGCGSVDNLGLLSVASSGGRGGCVSLSGGRVVLGGSSRIDANGAYGGGSVLVGGDWHGGGSLLQAGSTRMQSGARIDAAATRAGNGGEVVLWSSLQGGGSTLAAGSIDAQGAGPGGLGGRVETSGASVNLDGLRVDAAGAGGSGLWLIDPYDYAITSSAAANIASALDTGTSVGVVGPGGGFSQNGGNLSIGGNGSIGSSGSVTLNNVSSTGGLQVVSGGGSIQRTAGGSIATGGSATFTAPCGTVSLGSGNSFGSGLTVEQSAPQTTGRTGTTTSGAGGWVFQLTMLVPPGRHSEDLPVLLDVNGTPAWVSLVPGARQGVAGLALPSSRLRGRRDQLGAQSVQRSEGRLLIVDLRSDAASGGAAQAHSSHHSPERP